MLKEIELSHNADLAAALDAYVDKFDWGSSPVRIKPEHGFMKDFLYKTDVSKEFVTSRLVGELSKIMEGRGTPHYASDDSNVIHIASNTGDVEVQIRGLFGSNEVEKSGETMYPPNHGYMGWHTNDNAPGYRLYLSYARQGEKSWFRYILDGKPHTAVDRAGWNFRLFKVGSPSLWHCVYSETTRISIGFRIKENEQTTRVFNRIMGITP
jgi:hypothetical protein